MNKKYVVIGGDAAGMSAASKIRRMQPDSKLVVFEKGRHISFAACGIPYWISGVIDDGSKLQVLTPKIAKEKRNIDVRTLHEVTQIDLINVFFGQLTQYFWYKIKLDFKIIVQQSIQGIHSISFASIIGTT